MKKITLLLVFALIMVACASTLALAAAGDGDIVRQFVVNAPHAGENCTENAVTVKEFGPGTDYGPIMTNGVPDPFFAGGGVQFFPTQKSTLKVYVLAVDFDDLKGDNYAPYGLQSSVIISGSSIYDMTYPEVIYNMIFHGSRGLSALPNHKFQGSGSVTLKAIKQRLEEMSMGRMTVEVECLNERLAIAKGLDPLNDKWPWFHLDGPMLGYAVQGPADCEDYRQFARLHQAGIDAAYRDIPGLDIEDIDFIYTITPVSSHGHRSGLQGGAGLDTSFSFNDQALIQRDSEYRHEPGIKTKGGRVVGSGVFGVKGVTRSPSASITTSMHEFTHGLGMFDDYSYGSLGTNTGETTGSGAGNWGVMGSSMATTSPDLPAWRKFRMGWIDDDEIVVVLPGDSVTVNLRALGSFPGDGGSYTDDSGIITRMIAIPKEYRSRDTFGVNDTTTYGYPWLGNVWACGWNPNRTSYNWFDWFTNPWIGGETNAIKSWPTFYTLECRKQLGVDNGMSSANTGVVVGYIANPTTETGHGAGGFKIVSGATGLRASGTNTWVDNNIGLTIRVNSSNAYYDNVTITYTGQKAGSSNATKYYTGLLKASNNFVTADQAFDVDFDLTTWGRPGVNDSTGAPVAATKTATPVGVPGGVAGYTMTVTFDAANLEYVPGSAAGPFTYTVDDTAAVSGTLLITASGTEMIDKDIILSLRFKAKAGAANGTYAVSGKISDVTLLNWRGQKLGEGSVPGFDGVATIGNGTFAQFHSNNNFTITAGITSFEGRVKVDPVPAYTVSGQIVCETPGPAEGSFIGVESVVEVRSGATVLGTAKSNWDGYYTIQGIPAGTDYTISATKPKYDTGISEAFDLSGDTAIEDIMLTRQTFTVSGTIYGSYNSDGSGATPLAGVDVYLLNTGNANSVIGGPVKTAANGTYTVRGTELGKSFVAVAVSVKGTEYESLYLPQLYLEPNLHLPQAGITELLAVNLGFKYGEHSNDYIYPANTATFGRDNLYVFSLTGNRTGRNVTLTQTQDIRIRMTTKSTAIRYQLKDMDGTAVGALLSSVGTSNGDDIIRNVLPGEYYIEASRSGYISGCTMPIIVTSTRVVLRNAAGTNYMDLLAAGSGNTISGKVVDSVNGEVLEGVSIVCNPLSTTYGRGVAIKTAADGLFSYLVVTGNKNIVFAKEGYVTKTVNQASGGASNLIVELERVSLDNYKPVLKIAKVAVSPGGTVDVTYSIEGNSYGYTTLDLDLPYDSSIYKPILVTPAAALGDGTKGMFATNPTFEGKDVLKIAYVCYTEVVGDGPVFTVKYEVVAKPAVNEVALSGKVIKVEINRFYGDFDAVDLQVEEGALFIGLLGDINGDGLITPEDAILLLQMYVGLVPWTERALLFGDVNGDGLIDSTDAALILRMVVGG